MGSELEANYAQQQTTYTTQVQGDTQGTQQTDSSSVQDEEILFQGTENKYEELESYLDEDIIDAIATIQDEIGVDNFYNQIDTNQNGKIDDDESRELTGMSDSFSEKQVENFIYVLDYIHNVNSNEEENSTVDSDSNKKDADTTTGANTEAGAKREVAKTETTEPKDGRISVNEYDADGKLISSITKSEDGKTVIDECTYDNNGKITTKNEYYNPLTGEKTEHFEKYDYDKDGKLISKKIYNGSDDNSELAHDFEYVYDGENADGKHPTKRIDKANNETMIYGYDDNFRITSATYEDNDGNLIRSETYEYAENGQRKAAEYKDKDGNIIRSEKYNENGMVETVTKDDKTSCSEYSNAGIKTAEETYNEKDVDENGKIADNASMIEQAKYEDGEEKVRITYDDNKTSFYDGTKLTAEIKDGYAYVYEYDSSGNKTVAKKYNKSDIDEFGQPLSGKSPISTEDASSQENDFAKTQSSSSADTTGGVSKEASNKLLELAQTTGGARGTVGWCLGGVSDTLAAAYGSEQSLYGIESAKDADSALRGEMPGYEATAAHFSEVTNQYSEDDLANLPAGYIVIYEADPSYGDGVNGHIYVSNGTGGGYSDHFEEYESPRSGVKYSIFAPKD